MPLGTNEQQRKQDLSHGTDAPRGTTIECDTLCAPLEVKRLLGAGGQGRCTKSFSGEALAAKWYFENCRSRQRISRTAAGHSINSPSDAFLWPISLLEPSARAVPI